jgi:hypothetical protein
MCIVGILLNFSTLAVGKPKYGQARSKNTNAGTAPIHQRRRNSMRTIYFIFFRFSLSVSDNAKMV